MKKKSLSKLANGSGIHKEIRDLAGIVKGNSTDIRRLGAIVGKNSEDIERLGVIVKENSVDIRRLGVIVEESNDKIDLVAEQYGDIKKTLDEHTVKLDAHTEMIGSMATDIEVIKTDIEFIKGGLKKKVDVEEFFALEKRVSALERRKSAA